MTAIEKLLNTVKAELGYIEKKSKSQLDDKTANAGAKNYTKYARDLDAISGFYNGKKQGYEWCDVFVDWCFVQTFGEELARKLTCQTSNRKLGAGCKYSMNYYKADGKFYTTPAVGDQIFFYTTDKKGIRHTGIVVRLDDNHVYTIEGNSRPTGEYYTHGGAVLEHSYLRVDDEIAGYGRPDYSIVPVEDDKEPEAQEYVPTVLEWQKAAMEDGFDFPQYGADGKWGKECESVAKKAVVKKQVIGYKYPNLTKIVQRVVGFTGIEIDGKCGRATRDAIKAYQKAHGLTVDGCVGLNTWKVMLNI